MTYLHTKTKLLVFTKRIIILCIPHYEFNYQHHCRKLKVKSIAGTERRVSFETAMMIEWIRTIASLKACDCSRFHHSHGFKCLLTPSHKTHWAKWSRMKQWNVSSQRKSHECCAEHVRDFYWCIKSCIKSGSHCRKIVM